jgi:hypothetical protein
MAYAVVYRWPLITSTNQWLRAKKPSTAALNRIDSYPGQTKEAYGERYHDPPDQIQGAGYLGREAGMGLLE